jgi:hypothetical protein
LGYPLQSEAADTPYFETPFDIGKHATIRDKGCASKTNRNVARARGFASLILHKIKESIKSKFCVKKFFIARVSFIAGLCLIEFVYMS